MSKRPTLLLVPILVAFLSTATTAARRALPVVDTHPTGSTSSRTAAAPATYPGADQAWPGGAGLIATTLSGGYISRAIVADVDNDGIQELLSAAMAPSRVDIFKGSDMGYTLSTSLPFPQWAAALAVADTDGDGRNELVAGTGQSDDGGYVYVGEVTGTPGTFVVEWQSGWIGTLRWGRELAIGDGDGDGLKEIAVAVSWYGPRLEFEPVTSRP